MLQIEQACILGMRNNILSNVTLDIRIQKNFMLQIIKTHTHTQNQYGLFPHLKYIELFVVFQLVILTTPKCV